MVCVLGAVVVTNVPDLMIVVAADEGTVLNTMRCVEVVCSVVAGSVVLVVICVVRTMVCEHIHQGTVELSHMTVVHGIALTEQVKQWFPFRLNLVYGCLNVKLDDYGSCLLFGHVVILYIILKTIAMNAKSLILVELTN